MDIEETRLPGIGLRHDFALRGGQHMGVVSQTNGDRELFLYDRVDPDACRAVLHLKADEAATVAELLGAPRVTERLARLRDQVEGITSNGIPLAEDSPFVGRTLGEAQVRARTGASIVAIVRADAVLPSPNAEQVFAAGDKVIVVGTDDGVEAAAQLLAGR